MFFDDGRKWFEEKRSGLFIHYGLYSVHELHEQEEWRYSVPQEQYDKLIHEFDPRRLDPAEWLDAAESAGLEYLVLTAKHHDGFCLWNTAETNFNVMNSPFGKDIIALVAEECHRRDFPLVLYYSAVDWHHPAYPNLGRHHEIATDPSKHDLPAYVEFVKRQLTELFSNYGKIHGLWWDMNVPEYQDPSVNELVRRLQPGVIINNRGFGPGDFSTPERSFQSEATLPFVSATEACDCIGMSSWSYRADEDYHSLRSLERKCAVYTALGGNFLLGASPGRNGIYADKPKQILKAFGAWHKKVKPALTAPPCPGVVNAPNILCTGGGRELNLVLLEPANGETLFLPGLTETPVKAEILNTGETVEATMEPNVYTMKSPPMLRLRRLPCNRMNDEIQVIRLTFAGPVIHAADIKGETDRSGSVAKE